MARRHSASIWMNTSTFASLPCRNAPMSSAWRAWRSVAHSVNHVVHTDADSEGRIFFGMSWIVCPLPGVAEIRVERNRDHYATMAVIDSTPVRNGAVIPVGLPAPQGPLARHLISFSQIVDGVKYGVVAGDLDDGAVGKDAFHALVEPVPFLGSPEIVEHQEAATQQVVA